MLATWGCSTFPKPTLSLDFAGATSLDSGITFSRGSQATLFDSTGTLIFAPSNVIRNNTMQGAVAGTPGTLPTNWGIGGGGVGTLTQQVVGTGTINGINYIDVKFSGTTSNTDFAIAQESTTEIVAANGQNWVASTWIAIVGGSTANITSIFLNIAERTSAGVFVAQQNGPNLIGSLSGTLTRYTASYTLAGGATVARIQPRFLTFSYGSGVAIDITLRIGMPQLERGSVATAVNATSGTAYYAPRFDYNPSTLQPLGLLIEEQRTNSIRNNTMQGAVAGTPGTLPTNWSIFTSLTGLTREVVGTGTENGIDYIDFRLSGTPSAAGSYNFHFETITAVAASVGQAWTLSTYAKLQAGSFTGISSFQLIQVEYNSASGFLTQGTSTISPTSAALNTQRFSYTRTTSNASVAYLRPSSIFNLTGAAIDITLRIGLPQMELGAFATSVIPTTTTALTRNADVASMTGTNFSSWYNNAEYTIFHKTLVQINNDGIVYGGVGNSFNDTAYFSRTAPNQFAFVRSGGSETAALSVSFTPTAGVAFQQALAVKADDFAFCVNGGTVSTDTSGAVPTSAVRLSIGNAPWTASGGGQRQQWVQRITFYPTRLPDVTLQALTA